MVNEYVLDKIIEGQAFCHQAQTAQNNKDLRNARRLCCLSRDSYEQALTIVKLELYFLENPNFSPSPFETEATTQKLNQYRSTQGFIQRLKSKPISLLEDLTKKWRP